MQLPLPFTTLDLETSFSLDEHELKVRRKAPHNPLTDKNKYIFVSSKNKNVNWQINGIKLLVSTKIQRK